VHAFPSLQLIRTAPTQRPALQRSPVVQALESLQEFASFAVATQAPESESHASSVHELPSSQPRTPADTQVPAPSQAPSVQASRLEQ
jgi:hypothetical protein